jgi:nicotinamidase-related amidase
MRDVLLAVDIFGRFDHADGSRLLESLETRQAGFHDTWRTARARGIPVVYANDAFGDWQGNAQAIVDRALSGPAAPILQELVPQPGDAFVVKPRYSAFDLTPLELVLKDVDRLLLVGLATEMCVTQTAIDARERGFKVTVITSACASVDREMEDVALRYLESVTGSVLASKLP